MTAIYVWVLILRYVRTFLNFAIYQKNLRPLHTACQMGHSSCVKVLIEDCNADPNSRAKVRI